MPATITLNSLERYILDENIALAAITPGHLVEIGAGGQLQPHTTAAGTVAQSVWAVENELIGRDINTVYAIGETVKVAYPQPGALIYAWLIDEGNVARGAALESGDNGVLQAVTVGKVVAFAEEAVNNTGGSGAVRIKVRAA